MRVNKNLMINMMASIIGFLVSSGISFFIGPYIIRTVGIEAYGFITLSNNIVSYLAIITIALNSMSSRFITLSFYKKEINTACEYYSSTFFANLFCVCILTIPIILLVFNVDKVINVPTNLVFDVKLLLGFLLLNFLLGLLATNLNVSYFIKNKLYLSSLRGIEGNILRAILIIALFYFFEPRVYYIGLVTLIIFIYTTCYNIFYKFKLIPELKINRKYFDFKKIKELMFSGIWNVFIRLGSLLLDGMDLLITNLFIDSTAMGVLALAKTIPAAIQGMLGAIVGIFTPDFVNAFARNDFDGLKKQLQTSIIILSFIINIPIGLLIAFGTDFFKLWVPSQDPHQLQILSVLTIGALIVSGSINTIFNVFTATNKLKVNAISLIVSGVVSTGFVFVLLKTTNLGIYAVAGVSCFVTAIKNLVVVIPYACKCIKQKWYVLYPHILKSFLSIFVIMMFGYVYKIFVSVNSWIVLILSGIAVGAVSAITMFFILLSKGERKECLAICKNVLNKKRG